ncbi:hypothetical protein ACSBR2_024983 [Camellia fascicularis]
MGSTKVKIPPKKAITLSSLIARRLAREGGVDEPFAWESREYLRKLCMEKDVTFKVDYTIPSIGREFGSVFLGDANVALMVVSKGWVKVGEQGQQKGDASPFLTELLRLEEQAKQQGLGCWTRVMQMVWLGMIWVAQSIFSKFFLVLSKSDGDVREPGCNSVPVPVLCALGCAGDLFLG